jgi:hypothetical protein
MQRCLWVRPRTPKMGVQYPPNEPTLVGAGRGNPTPARKRGVDSLLTASIAQQTQVISGLLGRTCRFKLQHSLESALRAG